MRLNSIKFELSILYTVILGVILIAFSGVLYFISNIFFQQIDQRLIAKAQAIDFTIKSYAVVLGDNPNALAKAVEKTLAMKNELHFSSKLRNISDDWLKKVQALNLNKDYINFFKKNSSDMVSSSNLDKDLRAIFVEDAQFARKKHMRFKSLNYQHKVIRVLTYPLMLNSGGEYFIQVGDSQDPIVQQLRNWLYSIIISLPLILLLTSFVGRQQAKRILEPVYKITDMANNITHQDLSVRIKAKHFDREMESLVESFNDMIARLEKSFKHIEEFSHNVAHELKTPLTIIKGEADLILRKDRTAAEYQQALRIVLEESERVFKTVEDLLLLAKLDYQPGVFKFETFDFVEFFNEVCEQIRILAAHKTIVLALHTDNLVEPILVEADKFHLRRVFFNIIDNAIKFTPERGRIDINIKLQHDKIITSIADTGPGIPRQDLPRIFDRFVKIGNHPVSNGLGLNIAWTIVKLHKGEIMAESQVNAGTTFKIFLPVTA